MRLSLPISVSLLLAALAAHAQTADDFFNSGAQFYISNNIPSALERTESGLKIYPNDEKLQKLEKLLKQQQQSQSQQNQQNQQQQQSQSQQNSKSQQNQQQDQQNSQDQKKGGQQKSNEEKKENQNGKGQPVKSGQMTPEEAKRLLDAQKGDEQVLQMKPQDKPENQNKPAKDW